MKRRYLSIPSDLADKAWEKYTGYGINIVAKRDSGGNSTELEVPYYREGNEQTFVSYRVLRKGKDVKVRVMGTRFRGRLSKDDKQKLITLFNKIDEYEPPPLPHSPVIVTACA